MVIRLDGPDVSHYQYFQNGVGNPDFRKCAAAGCWWGAFKLTQSTGYVDPTAATTRAGMRDAGFTHIGPYHWLSSTTDPVKQAEWYLEHLGELRPGEFAMLDAEEAGITVDMALEWFNTVEPRTLRPGTDYSGAFVADGTIWRSAALMQSPFGPRPKILAAYTTEAKMRALPGVAESPPDGWQYSSDGPVPGITGRCDMNRIDNRPAFDLAAGIGQPTPTPTQPTEADLSAFTHSDNDHDGHPARFTFWRLMPDGTKRHIGEVELGLLGERDSAPAIPMADIDTLPDYVAPGPSATATPKLSGTWATG